MEMQILATYINLAIALVAFPLGALWARRSFALSQPTIKTLLPLYAYICTLVILVLLLVVYGENREFASMGGMVPGMQVWVFGIGIGIAGVFIFGAIGALIRRLRIPSYEPALEKLLVLPVWFRCFIAIISGITEEIMFRGIGLNRIAELSGSTSVAAVTTIVIFAAAHYPNGRWGQTILAALLGSGFTAVYLYTDNLVLNIIAHVTMDIMGFVLFPALAGKQSKTPE
ncbi:MAG: CPBP family intramembrane metalloprotease [Gammaproteobacteria bacterium]|nr:CPBP family intramembrane metalloprotease [Gammaproteobacteria bacterium]